MPLRLPLRLTTSLALAAAGLALAAPALAQTTSSSSPAASGGSTFRTTGDARRDTIARMGKRMNLEVTESRLEDVLNFIKETTGADLEIIWQGDGDSTPGLDRERKITLNIKNRSALAIMEAALDKAKGDFGGGNGWQMTPYGTMQVGPKDALNKDRRVETYDINDLLTVLPRYAEVPEIDLNSVLQQSQGGSGGQSPFTDAGTDNNDPPKSREDRAKDIIDILVANVEPEQWSDNGGEAATIRHYNGTLIVNAPDYVHRQISGYPYWPSYTTSSGANGRRWLTLNADTGASRIDGFGTQPVTALVNGRPVSSGGGGRLTNRPGPGSAPNPSTPTTPPASTPDPKK